VYKINHPNIFVKTWKEYLNKTKKLKEKKKKYKRLQPPGVVARQTST